MTAEAGEVALTARNASIEDLAELLRGQQARKVDVVAPASAIRAEDGCLVLDGTVPVLGEDGVTMTAGRYRPTGVRDQGIAERSTAAVAVGFFPQRCYSHNKIPEFKENLWNVRRAKERLTAHGTSN